MLHDISPLLFTTDPLPGVAIVISETVHERIRTYAAQALAEERRKPFLGTATYGSAFRAVVRHLLTSWARAACRPLVSDETDWRHYNEALFEWFTGRFPNGTTWFDNYLAALDGSTLTIFTADERITAAENIQPFLGLNAPEGFAVVTDLLAQTAAVKAGQVLLTAELHEELRAAALRKLAAERDRDPRDARTAGGHLASSVQSLVDQWCREACRTRPMSDTDRQYFEEGSLVWFAGRLRDATCRFGRDRVGVLTTNLLWIGHQSDPSMASLTNSA